MTEFAYDTVISTLAAGGVRCVTLNRPARLNAMNLQLIRDVTQAFRDAHEDPDSNAILFTGAGRAFCAGDDRHDHSHPDSAEQARALVEGIQDATRAISFGPKPVVGAINGWAVGGGFEWAINCDFPVWAESAKGFFPEVSLNLFVTGAVTSLLPALAGLQKAREMLFLGQRYSAAELHEAGVAWRVVPDAVLHDEAMAVARKLASLPPLAVRAMKRTLNLTACTDMHRALQLETDATVAGFMDPETTRLLKDF
ncbi:enoyl-CoA hydratase/isomerase family protein [Roseinatronobacter bogoriensis]|uniref:Enoyl-CoA hydratase/isomerase family protein n=1 Tax=Roseinatronobacter bogoriensis subsp. barguzinensis TaxID=441209 RepID=A0A2K8K866_9RHOB|nr:MULTISPECIES: enoyl-CoA hydratase/isomerase family protein [Rhodobaca]ATX65652.1 enoyl-CoA hydratase/isomerase family protein [Rhodobaca barguzinensis]MBB4208407.1 enoyl-CoA hydratase/carnithine racemase [Rhodobaca bogoriensis DSM 18756]TDW39049.1 enoyl-CoA hydratase/carnithine racemase [Rhodobaca barguzinensis]TDY68769.1 enoyl-CoA hydratase/carnithine racemase [Rhodobaca bogoriensis DSM 18756]